MAPCLIPPEHHPERLMDRAAFGRRSYTETTLHQELSMRKLLAIVLLIAIGFLAQPCRGWSRSGHGIIGTIAWQYLSDKAKACVAVLLGGQTLAEAGHW